MAELGIEDVEFKRQCEKDTGFLARNVLGYDYDMDPANPGEKMNVGTGGIRRDGPHSEMVEFIDRSGKHKLLISARDSYKSTLVKSKCVQTALKKPNSRILYGMDDLDGAEGKVGAIFEHFENDERLKELWGVEIKDQKSFQGRPWSWNSFTLSTRTQTGLDNPTFSIFSVEKHKVGGHFDLIVFDDMIVHTKVTAEWFAKVIRVFQFAQPLLDPGGQIIICCTRYGDGDLAGWIKDNENILKRFDVLEIDCGMFPEKDEGEEPELVGTPRFVHLTKEYLEEKLDIMKLPNFMSQYCNNPVGGAREYFSARDFVEVEWDETWMPEMPCYMLTDTATTEKEENCHSVVGIGGLGWDNRFYLLDMSVGHWRPDLFVTKLLDMVVKWETKVEIRGICMEQTTLNRVFFPMIDDQGRTRRIRMPWIIKIPRQGSEANKNQRIRRLTGRIAERKFAVVKGFPKHFRDLGKRVVLWDPEGAKDGKGRPYPDGELVRQFTRFPAYTMKDIADALADIDGINPMGLRYCQPMSRMAKKRKRRARQNWGQPLTMRETASDGRFPKVAGDNPHSFWTGLAERTKS